MIKYHVVSFTDKLKRVIDLAIYRTWNNIGSIHFITVKFWKINSAVVPSWHTLLKALSYLHVWKWPHYDRVDIIDPIRMQTISRNQPRNSTSYNLLEYLLGWPKLERSSARSKPLLNCRKFLASSKPLRTLEIEEVLIDYQSLIAEECSGWSWQRIRCPQFSVQTTNWRPSSIFRFDAFGICHMVNIFKNKVRVGSSLTYPSKHSLKKVHILKNYYTQGTFPKESHFYNFYLPQ